MKAMKRTTIAAIAVLAFSGATMAEDIGETALIGAKFRMFACLQKNPIPDGVYGNSWDELKQKVLAPSEALCATEYIAAWTKLLNGDEAGAVLSVDLDVARMRGCEAEHEGGPIMSAS
jgi:hypothetical protein